MGITTTIRPVIRNIPVNDRRLPIGMWFGRVSITGDASGGQSTGIILLERKANVAYNVNLFGISTDRPVSDVAQLLLTTGERANEATEWNLQQFFTLSANAAGAGLSLSVDFLKNFIFQPTTDDGSVELSMPNTNLFSIVVVATGYVWDGEAYKLSGGPRLPAFVSLVEG